MPRFYFHQRDLMHEIEKRLERYLAKRENRNPLDPSSNFSVREIPCILGEYPELFLCRSLNFGSSWNRVGEFRV